MTPIKKSSTNNFSAIALTGIIISLTIGFWPMLHKMALRWESGDNSYCYLVIPLFLFLLWEQKDQFQFQKTSWNYTGLAPAFLSLLLIFVGELSSIEAVIFAGIWGCLVSIIVSLYGWRTKHLLFPIIILLFIVPLPPYINRMITFKLKLLASTMSADMLRAAGITVLREGNILDLGISKLQVVDACSGLRYLMSMVLMALLIGYYFAKQWWRQIFIIALVPPMLVAINAIRIFLSGLFIVNGYPELVSDTAHDIQGIIFFLLAGLAFWLMALLFNKIAPMVKQKKATTRIAADKSSTSKKLAITVTLSLLFLGGGFYVQHLGKTSTTPPRTEFKEFPQSVGEWQGKRHYLSQEILDALWADDYISASFYKKNTKNTIYLLIPFYEYQGTRHTAHAPQSCLLGGGYEIVDSKIHQSKMPNGDVVSLMSLMMAKGEGRLLANYFFLQRGRIVTNPWLNKYYLLKDAILKNRTDGALVRIEITLGQNQSIEQGYALLDEFLISLWPLLPDYIPQ